MLPTGLLKENAKALLMTIRLIDMVVVGSAAVAAYFIRFSHLEWSNNYIVAIILSILLLPFILTLSGHYAPQRGQRFILQLSQLFKGTLLLALVLSCLAFLTKSGDAYSRIWFLIWMILTYFGLLLVRTCLILGLRYMRARGMNEKHIVIFGAGPLAKKIATNLQQALWTGFKIVAIIDDAATKEPQIFRAISIIPPPTDLHQYLHEYDIDEIWIALPLAAEDKVKAILHTLRYETITTRFVLDIFNLDLLNHSITEVAGFPVLNIQTTPMRGINRVIKAFEDRLLAGLILMAIFPLLLLIAGIIKLTSKGPVLFKQQRLGWDGKIIKVYKFRTMHIHTEANNVLTQASQTDKRVTAVGKWLRRTSLDELPQFINVLQGRMSIVGPRPHALLHNEMYKDSIQTYMQRYRVKPGITGWAQINGWRGETNTLDKMQKRVEYDLYYIENWSLGFDLKIILLTFFKGFIHRNAY